MIIAVGSVNKVKVDAVKELIIDYPSLANSEVIACSVPSEISEQPLSLSEIILGAKNRAKNAFHKMICQYGIGLESGLFEAPGSQTGYLEACVCSIYNGNIHFLGISSGFEIPPTILELILKKKMDLNQASYHSAISTNPHLGSSDGLIGLLTKGKMTRKEYTKQCLVTALIQIENPHFYNSKPIEKGTSVPGR